MDVASSVTLLIFIAALTETLVDMFKSKFGLGQLGSDNLKGIVWPSVAAVFGIGLAFAFNASVLPLVSETLAVNIAWPIDRVLAGLIAGVGGASLIYDWLSTKTA